MRRAGQIVLQVCAVNIRYVDLAAGNAPEKLQAPGGSFEDSRRLRGMCGYAWCGGPRGNPMEH